MGSYTKCAIMLLKLVMNFITIALLLYQMTVYYTYYKCSASKIMQIQTYAAYCSCLFVLTLITFSHLVCVWHGQLIFMWQTEAKSRPKKKSSLASIKGVDIAIYLSTSRRIRFYYTHNNSWMVWRAKNNCYIPFMSRMIK